MCYHNQVIRCEFALPALLESCNLYHNLKLDFEKLLILKRYMEFLELVSMT